MSEQPPTPLPSFAEILGKRVTLRAAHVHLLLENWADYRSLIHQTGTGIVLEEMRKALVRVASCSPEFAAAEASLAIPPAEARDGLPPIEEVEGKFIPMRASYLHALVQALGSIPATPPIDVRVAMSEAKSALLWAAGRELWLRPEDNPEASESIGPDQAIKEIRQIMKRVIGG